MKIRITETIEVDPEKWATEFGLDKNEVREDVKEYFSFYCQGEVERLGLDPVKHLFNGRD